MNFKNWITNIEKMTMQNYTMLDGKSRQQIKANFADYMYNVFGVVIDEKR